MIGARRDESGRGGFFPPPLDVSNLRFDLEVNLTVLVGTDDNNFSFRSEYNLHELLRRRRQPFPDRVQFSRSLSLGSVLVEDQPGHQHFELIEFDSTTRCRR